MPHAGIRCCAAPDVDETESSAIARALDDVIPGTERVTGGTSENGHAVLLLRRASADVVAQVQELSGMGARRLVVVALGPVTPAEGWQLLQAGASDVMTRCSPGDMARALASRFARWDAIDAVVNTPATRSLLVGESPVWTRLLRQVVEVARFTDLSVLVIGESGTGKELIARLIHMLDPRAAKRELVLVDCTTVVPELSGSEFFGHERGAFTGAVATREGAFALANGGTLFLDEVGELPPPLQAELLRVVQEGTYKRVGSNSWQRTAFRLVCATNRDLLEEEARGRFRRDFYARIAGWVCRLPPLRERPEDILPLAAHFWRLLRGEQAPPQFDPAVREYLLRYDYRGNVRDLRRLVAAMASRHVGDGPVTLGAIPEHERPVADVEDDWRSAALEPAIRIALLRGAGLEEIGRASKRVAVRLALAQAGNNVQRAAAALGVSERAIQQRTAACRGVPVAESPFSLEPMPSVATRAD